MTRATDKVSLRGERRSRLAISSIGVFGLIGVVTFGSVSWGSAPVPIERRGPAADDPVDFNREIRPILARRCFVCHGPDVSTRKADLRLDEREYATAANRAGGRAAVLPGDAAASLLIERITSHDSKERMPFGEQEPLLVTQIETLRRWIDEGAPYAQHWSWAPPSDHRPPAVGARDWPSDSVDRFILSRLEAAGLAPAPPADRRTLIRRVYYDLIGLPPTPQEVAAFVNDSSPDAYEVIVDRLLGSPRFGERWGRHWLDLMRYAETHGHEFDYPIRHAWQYRDYVIRALNADVPYDDFVREHLAGDLLDPPRRHPDEDFNESIIGTGFWYLSQGTHAPVDVRADEAERIANQIDVLSKTFLATTVSCARCHDHKFDPVLTKDFYSLAGFMQSSRRQEAYLDPGGRIATSDAVLKALHEQGRTLLGQSLPTSGRAKTDAISKYLLAARQVMHGEPKPRDGDIETTSVLFDDFEGAIYDRWEAKGTAFGDGPNTQATIGQYQGDVGADGEGFVNSHNVHSGEDVRGADQHLGTLTSDSFLIEHDFVHFLIGGGAHKGKTCLDLIIDGETVRTATGRNSNRMHRDRFDVREFAGREARFRIVDNESGGWGNIGVDHILFSNDEVLGVPNRRPIDVVARELKIDPERLRHWVRAMRDPAIRQTSHPLHAWATIALRDEDSGGDDDAAQPRAELAARLDAESDDAASVSDASVLFEDFDGDRFDDWFVSGAAFGDHPIQATDIQLDGGRLQPMRPGVAHSGRLAGRLQGTLRSRTFEITHRNIFYRVAGRGGRIRLTIDGYYLDDYNALLFGGITFDVNSDGEWKDHRQNVAKYLGHRAYIEMIDDGDGFIAVDDIRFADDNRAAPRPDPLAARIAGDDSITTHSRLARAYQQAYVAGLGRWRRGDATTSSETALLGWLLTNDLLDAGARQGEELASSLEAFHAAVREQSAATPAPMRVLALADGTPEDEYVFVRGEHTNRGEMAPRGFIESLTGPGQPPISAGSGRLELAERLLADTNPLPARVIVNRVWLHLFARGIVPTPDNFGALGEMPTHPELLDHLALWFSGDGEWSTKRLIRRLVLTSTYRMSSRPIDPGASTLDPNNDLLHAMRVKRLEGEAIRDGLLAISGRLETKMFGAPVPVHLTPFMTGRGRPGRSGPVDGAGRRSIYISVRRNFLSPMMLAFDTPIPSSTVGRRSVSNVPAQALILMNDPFVIEQARVWAKRLLADGDLTPEMRISRMYEYAFARPPTEREIASAVGFLEFQAAAREPPVADWARNEDLWADLCHVIVNVKEFIYVH